MTQEWNSEGGGGTEEEDEDEENFQRIHQIRKKKTGYRKSNG